MENSIMINKEGYRLSIDKASGCIKELYDSSEEKGENLSDPRGGFGSITLTHKGQSSYHTEASSEAGNREYIVLDDINACHKVISWDKFSVTCRNSQYNSTVKYDFSDEYFLIGCETDSKDISQFGLNIDLNYLGKPYTSFWGQVLPTSPYTSSDGKSVYYLMSRPNGKWVLITALNEIDGWKLEYSPYNFGHFILNLKMLESFDEVFKSQQASSRRRMVLRVEFPSSYKAAIERVSQALQLPIPHFPLSGGRIGCKLPVEVTGRYKKLLLHTPSGKELDITGGIIRENTRTYVSVELQEEGFHRVEAVGERNRSMDCSLFAFGSWNEMFERACNTIKEPYHCDENLTEGGIWCWALCSFMRINGVQEGFADQVKAHLHKRVMSDGGEEPVPRCSIVPWPHEYEARQYGAYHIYKSTRIQEQFFGVSILLEAYRAFEEVRYIEYAANTMMNLLEEHVEENGKIRCYEKNGVVDYTTVCAPVIAVVDLAHALEGLSDPRGAVLYEAAEKIADYLVNRGLDFPTEGDQKYAQKEMEDGSISCTALSVLYVCSHVKYKPEYIRFAGEILTLHDAWSIYTPDVRMYRSSFRWWETIWEGDQDGPGINAGHAWTLWRGEAEYHYAILTGDIERFMDSYNAYMTNLCKISPEGITYSCYTPDYIPGRTGIGVLVHRYPLKTDNSLSRYLWARAADTWLRAGGIHSLDAMVIPINGTVLHCNGVIHFESAAPDLKYFVIGDINGTLAFNTCGKIVFIAKNRRLQVVKGCLHKTEGIYTHVLPQDGKLEVNII